MGSWFSRKSEARIIIQGLDAAGKTSLLYRLKLGEVVTTIPTIGFNVETIDLKGISITCWDVGGRDKIRPLYRHYYQGASGLIFVLDSNDRERLEEALDQLVRYVLLEDELKQIVVMVLANKQDLPQALPATEIEKVLESKFTFNSNCRHSAFVVPCSVLTGDNLEMAMTYFGQQLRLKPEERQTGLYRPHLEKPDTPTLTTHSAFKSVVRNPLAALKALFY